MDDKNGENDGRVDIEIGQINLQDNNNQIGNHSFLVSERSFIDYFDDLGETESADSARLKKGKAMMARIYHPDRQNHRINNGTARHADIGVYERKFARCNKAAKILKIKANRSRHAQKVAAYKSLKPGGK